MVITNRPERAKPAHAGGRQFLSGAGLGYKTDLPIACVSMDGPWRDVGAVKGGWQIVLDGLTIGRGWLTFPAGFDRVAIDRYSTLHISAG